MNVFHNCTITQELGQLANSSSLNRRFKHEYTVHIMMAAT